MIPTLIEICPPQPTPFGPIHRTIFTQEIQWNRACNGPRKAFFDFRVHNSWQRMGFDYSFTVILGNFNPRPWGRIKMEEDGAATIHFKVEIAFGHIRTRREKEFNAAIPTDGVLMLLSYGPDVSVFDPEHEAYGRFFIGNLRLGLWKMARLLPHVVSDEYSRNLSPHRIAPICVDRERNWESLHQ